VTCECNVVCNLSPVWPVTCEFCVAPDLCVACDL